MSPDLQSEIQELQERLARLERAPTKRRGWTNLAGASLYLNESRETLRKKRARGEGPHGTQHGRFWRFTYDALDEYAQSTSESAA